MINPLNGIKVCDAIIKQDYSATEAAADYWVNLQTPVRVH